MDRGTRADSPAFSLKYPRPSEAAGAIRVVVSSKVAKKAVARNLIKRRLRHIWRLVGGGPAPYIYVKKAALNMSFAQLRAELTKLIK